MKVGIEGSDRFKIMIRVVIDIVVQPEGTSVMKFTLHKRTWYPLQSLGASRGIAAKTKSSEGKLGTWLWVVDKAPHHRRAVTTLHHNAISKCRMQLDALVLCILSSSTNMASQESIFKGRGLCSEGWPSSSLSSPPLYSSSQGTYKIRAHCPGAGFPSMYSFSNY